MALKWGFLRLFRAWSWSKMSALGSERGSSAATMRLLTAYWLDWGCCWGVNRGRLRGVVSKDELLVGDDKCVETVGTHCATRGDVHLE